MDVYFNWISLGAGITAAIIAIWQLAVQVRETKIGNRISSLESLSSMFRNAIADKQELLIMNDRKISQINAKNSLSPQDKVDLQKHKKAKKNRGDEIKSIYNGLLSINIERCELMGGIEEELESNVAKAIEDMKKLLERRSDA